MTARPLLIAGAGGVGLALLWALFELYRNPLFQIYLADWALC